MSVPLTSRWNGALDALTKASLVLLYTIVQSGLQSKTWNAEVNKFYLTWNIEWFIVLILQNPRKAMKLLSLFRTLHLTQPTAYKLQQWSISLNIVSEVNHFLQLHLKLVRLWKWIIFSIDSSTLFISAPTAPQILKLDNITNSSISVTWKAPKKTNGLLKYYQISYNNNTIRIDPVRGAKMQSIMVIVLGLNEEKDY